MKNIVLFDGQCHKSLLPLTFTRPVAHLRIGIFTISEKWMHFLGQHVHVRCKDYLTEKFNSFEGSADVGILAGLLPNQDIVDVISNLNPNSILMKDGNVLAISPLPKNNNSIETSLSKYATLEYDSEVSIINRPQDIFLENGKEIKADFNWILNNSKSVGYHDSNTVFGEDIFVSNGAVLRGCTINCEEGPVYIGENAQVMEGSVIRGPFALLDHSIVKMGAKIYGPSTVGPHCKVGGEIGNSVIQGFSNKAHDGYLGNSVIGEWCNLGADTNTSNLKNNYSNVKNWDYSTESMEDTGTQYCGLIMGDHSKCGINTMFNTGTVVGVSANIYGGGFPSKFIPSYSWGGSDGFVDYELNKAIELAEVVMKRRGIELSSMDEEILKHVFQSTKAYRN
jgi:UDP-N-acetylglucosamine diphosphorylase/glucosamine-1-phosphate N-acetyltransferase